MTRDRFGDQHVYGNQKLGEVVPPSSGEPAPHDHDNRYKTWHGVFFEDGLYGVSLAFDQVTRTVTVSPGPASRKSCYYKGDEVVFDSPATIVIPDVEGGWFVYLNSATTTLVASQTPWDLLEHVPLIYVAWDAANKKGKPFDERHHHSRDLEWHKSQHSFMGTYQKWPSDFGIGGYTLNQATDASIAWSLESGTVVDEDIETPVSAVPDGGPYWVFTKTGASGLWRWEQRSMPFAWATGGFIQFNQFTGGSWGLTQLVNNQLVNYYIAASPTLDPSEGVFVIPGQQVFASLSAAAEAGVDDLDLSGLPLQEFVFLWKITLQAGTGDSSTGKCRIVAVSRQTASRSQSLGAAPTVHNSLSGRSDPDAHPVSAITGLQSELDSKIGIGTVREDFIDTTTGQGIYRVTTALGVHDAGMLLVSQLDAYNYQTQVWFNGDNVMLREGTAGSWSAWRVTSMVGHGHTTTEVSEGTNLYFTTSRVRATALTGYSSGANTPLAATDTVLQAFGKIQGQLDGKAGLVQIQEQYLDSAPTGLAIVLSNIGLHDEGAVITSRLDSYNYQTQFWMKADGSIASRYRAGSAWTSWVEFSKVGHTHNYEPVIAAGTTLQYWRGDKSWQTLNTAAVPESGNLYFTEPRVRSTLLTGYSSGSNTPLSDTDSILQAFGKIQGQLDGKTGLTNVYSDQLDSAPQGLAMVLSPLGSHDEGAIVTSRYDAFGYQTQLWMQADGNLSLRQRIGGVWGAWSSFSKTTHNHDGSYSPLGHNHNSAYSLLGHSHTSVYFSDTRSTNIEPFSVPGMSVHLKGNSTDGLSDGGLYHGVVNITQWSDSSGGNAHQLALTDNGNLWHRMGTTAANMGAWKKLIDSSNIGGQSVYSATLFDGFSSASTLLNRGSVAESSLDTATGNGFYTVDRGGDSASLLTFNAGGSTGPLQILFDYLGNYKVRNKTDSSTWTAWRTLLTNDNTDYSFNVTCTARPAVNQKLLIFVAERAFKVKSTGHKGKCYTNPTTTSVALSLQKNGSQFGTLTFAINGAFTTSVTETSFAENDILTVVAPSSQNSTFADFGITLSAVLA